MPEQKHTLAQSLLPEQMLPGEAIFCVQGLDFAYSRPLLRNVNLALYPGQSIGLSGPNGAGKTSLFSLPDWPGKAPQGHTQLFG